MGKNYEVDYVLVRRTNGLEIVFEGTSTIYVKHKHGINVYNTWLVQNRKGFYKESWKPFRESLKYNKNIDKGYIQNLAYELDIDVTGSDEMPDLTGVEVRELPEHGRVRNRHARLNEGVIRL